MTENMKSGILVTENMKVRHACDGKHEIVWSRHGKMIEKREEDTDIGNVCAEIIAPLVMSTGFF